MKKNIEKREIKNITLTKKLKKNTLSKIIKDRLVSGIVEFSMVLDQINLEETV